MTIIISQLNSLPQLFFNFFILILILDILFLCRVKEGREERGRGRAVINTTLVLFFFGSKG